MALRQLFVVCAFIVGVIGAASWAHGETMRGRADRGEAGAKPEQSLRVDRVLVLKQKRLLHLMFRGKIVRSYRVALGFNPKGHKLKEGDGKTPEGLYTIDWRNPKSRFHLSLRINYPSDKDRTVAKAKGVPPGGDIFIHGLGVTTAMFGAAHSKIDWTAGCIAVTNKEIREIWTAVPDGTPIEIRP